MSNDPSPPRDGGAALSPVQSARLLAALEAAQVAAERSASEQRVARDDLQKQQQELDIVHESAQKLGDRARDIRSSLQLSRESLERAKLTALNAGLEGARLGEPAGKALVVMGDEVRGLLSRALDALDDHAQLLAEVDRDRDRCLAELAKLGDGTRSTSGALARAEQQGQLHKALLAELKLDLSELSGTDPETARVLHQATEQLKNTAEALRSLPARAKLDASALHELLRPLLALLPPEGQAEPR